MVQEHGLRNFEIHDTQYTESLTSDSGREDPNEKAKVKGHPKMDLMSQT